MTLNDEKDLERSPCEVCLIYATCKGNPFKHTGKACPHQQEYIRLRMRKTLLEANNIRGKIGKWKRK